MKQHPFYFGSENEMDDKRKCLLAVDDEENILDLYRSIFSTRYRVITASSAKAASQILSNHSIDIILLDLNMPDIYGLNFLSEIKKSQPLIPVIIVSGSCTLEISIRACQMGAAYCMTKPFDSHALVELVEHHIVENEANRHNE